MSLAGGPALAVIITLMPKVVATRSKALAVQQANGLKWPLWWFTAVMITRSGRRRDGARSLRAWRRRPRGEHRGGPVERHQISGLRVLDRQDQGTHEEAGADRPFGIAVLVHEVVDDDCGVGQQRLDPGVQAL